MILRGRSISSGKAKGVAIVYPEPFSFLGGVDGSTGRFNVMDGDITDKVFVFPNGKGSTVGSYVVYDLKVHGHAPLALVNRSAETIVTTGAVISDVPMVDGVDIGLIRDGDVLEVDGDTGTLDIVGIKDTHITVAMIVCDGKVLMTRREGHDHVSPGKWTLVTRYFDGEESPSVNVSETVSEFLKGSPEPVAEMPEFMVRNSHTVYTVHAYLFKASPGDVKLADSASDLRWVPVNEFTADGVTTSSVRAFEYLSKLL